MERKTSLQHQFLNLAGLLCLLLLSCSCIGTTPTGTMDSIRLVLPESSFSTRSYEPEEERLSDIHIFIFSAEGELEFCRHLQASELENCGEGRCCEVQLIHGRTYDIHICANIGIEPEIRTREELERLTCHLSWPDDYRGGIPMSASQEGVRIDRSRTLFLPLERLMAKISLQFDRSQLAEDVELTVRSVRIGNCPKRSLIFSRNTVTTADALFPNGFVRNAEECAPLNRNRKDGISDEITLYLLENMQGKIEGTDGTADGKLFPPEDVRSACASFIEISMEYLSPRYFTSSRELKYRFWLGEDNVDVNIERNCHYRIMVCPAGDGLDAEGWRIDKSGLQDLLEEVEFKILPGRYLEGRVGEDLHVWCEYRPSWANFDIGLEELENDKARGLYDYTLDRDGRGVVLHLRHPGQGILYMEAGPPVNRSDMVCIEILPAA